MNIKLFFVSFFSMVALDIVWLGFLMSNFYVKHLGDLGRVVDGKFAMLYWPAGIVYILMSLALVIFVLPRLAANTPFSQSFLYGALMGFILYGVYDMTNLATLRDWSITLCIVDMAWSTFLCGITAVILKLAQEKLI